ncbi:hypothetical protein ACWHAM_25910 [Paenibacillus terrae]
MQIIQGAALLLLVLFFFTLFSYKALKGIKTMGALASAACAGMGMLPGFVAQPAFPMIFLGGEKVEK